MENKFLEYYQVLDKWLCLLQHGKSIIDYFHRENIKSICIYGMQELGERLYEELVMGDITVVAVIDKNPYNVYYDIDITSIDNIPQCEAVVVTAFFYFDEIKRELLTHTNSNIISLEDIVYNEYMQYYKSLI